MVNENTRQTLQNKDFSNSESLLEWLKCAKEVVDENKRMIEDLAKEKDKKSEHLLKLSNSLQALQENLDESSEEQVEAVRDLEQQILQLNQELVSDDATSENFLKENEFLIKELNKLKSSGFLDKYEKEKAAELEEVLNNQDPLISDLISRLETLVSSEKKERRASLFVHLNPAHDVEKPLNTSSLFPNNPFSEESEKDISEMIKEHLNRVENCWKSHLDGTKKNSLAYDGQENIMSKLLPLFDRILDKNNDDTDILRWANELLVQW